MNVPWRFFVALAGGVLLGMICFVALLYTQLGVPTDSSSWAYVIMHKKEQRAASISGPRLLLLSGSNSLFGLNAQVITQETGYPTVNMGFHAGLDLDYLLYYIKRTARPGDTIFMPLEYPLYGREYNNDLRDDFILARDPGFFHQMSWLDILGMSTRIRFVRLQQGWHFRRHPEKLHPNSRYENSTDDYGDGTTNMLAERKPDLPALSVVCVELTEGIPSDHALGFDLLRDFIAWTKANHIRLLAGFPNLLDRPEYHGPKGKEAVEVITRFYESEGVPVVGNAWETLLPSDQFFDTTYHLTHEAAIERTKRLVPELLPYLQKTP
jgi:hypothetical protein